MIEFNGTSITMNRGDTVYIDTVIFTACDLIYELQDGDVITFVVVDNKKEEVLIREFWDRNLKLTSMDTAFLSEGCYRYKCILTMANGDRETYCEGDLRLI